MPAPISKIRLRNFKAFYGEEEIIDLDGKHLLLYGENGSGKSSIYWALYTLFQSSTKPQAEIQKYFDPQRDEHLINYFLVQENRVPDAAGNLVDPLSIGLNAYVIIELKDGISLRIDSRGIAPGTDKAILEEFNRKSDFISHRLLINFYNFRNSKNINLWEVFVRDVFPFVMDQKGSGTKTLSQVLKEIEENKPFKLYPTDQEFSLTRSQTWQNKYNIWINSFNSEVNYWLQELNLKISNFYNTHLGQGNSEKLKITLEYTDPLVFNKHTAHAFQKDGVEYLRYSNLCDLNAPFISLKIVIENPDGTLDVIHKPQSHLNEARLTSIALAVRFSLLDETIRTSGEGKILVLDDLLVSLDMGNRNKVLDIILKEFAPKYKIFLFTHERAFFNMVKERLENEYDIKKWKVKEIFPPFLGEKGPLINESLTNLSRAYELHRKRDYPAAINYMRKELEYILASNIPRKILTNSQGEELDRLDSVVQASIQFFISIHQDTSLLIRLRQYIKILLNPHSHYNDDTELYEIDLIEVRKILIELGGSLKNIKNGISEFCPRNTIMHMTFIESTTITQKYEIELLDDIWIFNDSGIISHSSCRVHSKRSQTISNGVPGEWVQNEHFKKSSLREFYEAVCTRKNTAPQTEYINFFEAVSNAEH